MMPGARRAYDSGLIAAFVGSALLFLVPQFFFIRQSLLPNLAPDVVSDTLSLENYRAIVTDPFYWGVFGRTIGLSVAVVAGTITFTSTPRRTASASASTASSSGSRYGFSMMISRRAALMAR